MQPRPTGLTNFNRLLRLRTGTTASIVVRARRPIKGKETKTMNKLSALMIGAAMVLGTAFAAQNAPKTADKPAEKSATTKKASKKHHMKTKKSAKTTAASTAVTTPAPTK
jgi:hypothetical protein